MSLTLSHRNPRDDRFGGDLTGAIVLHVAVLGAIAAFAVWGHWRHEQWGGAQEIQGSIQASMVSAIPLPHEQQPVDKQVLAPDLTSKAAEVPKPAAEPPPRPTDVLVKAKTPEKPAKPAPVEAPPPPKHAQPTPDTPKANVGQQATQLMQSTVQVGTGSSTITVLQQAAGARYAYYFGIVNRTIGQNWLKQEADPRTSAGHQVTLLFDIGRDGAPQNVRVETRSGSPSLDQSAVRALERIDSFGPSPAPGTVTIRDTFIY